MPPERYFASEHPSPGWEHIFHATEEKPGEDGKVVRKVEKDIGDLET